MTARRREQGNGNRVLVADASGALGAAVCHRLVATGHRVIGLTNSPDHVPALRALGVEPVVGDVLDAAWLEGSVVAAAPDAIVHVAGAVPPAGRLRARDMEPTNRLRTTGTHNLIVAAHAAGVRRFVAASHFLVYGLGDHGESPVDEDTPLAPLGPGPHPGRDVVSALRALEDQVVGVNEAGRMRALVLRLGSLYGPHVPAIRALVAQVRDRRVPVVGNGHAQHPWVHVDDAADVFVAAVRCEVEGVLNVADRQPLSVADLARAMAPALGVPEPRRIPRVAGRLVAPFTTAVLSTKLVMDASNAQELLDWQPVHTDVRAEVPHLVRPDSPVEAPLVA